MSILRFIRLPNLLIIALTQVLLGYILYGFILAPELSPFQFGLLILTTIFIAAGGYVINDIYDFEIDSINKPEKVVVGKKISVKNARLTYYLLIIAGGVVAAYLAYMIHDFNQFLIYPFATLMLWAYAKSLKKSFVIGNLVIAAYCALVPGIIWYAERKPYFDLLVDSEQNASLVRNIFIGYALMAFLTTVWREIIKDMEDVKGDKAYGSQSIPVKYGVLLAQKIATTLGAIVIILMVGYTYQLAHLSQWWSVNYLLVLILLAIYTVLIPFKSLGVKALHQVSQQIKWLMVLGLGYLFFLL